MLADAAGDQGKPIVFGVPKRGSPFVVGQIRRRSCLQQFIDDFVVTESRGDHERRDAVGILLVDRHMSSQEQLNDRQVLLANRRVKRASTVGIDIGTRSSLEEHFDDVSLVLGDRQKERGEIAKCLQVGIRSVFNQEPYRRGLMPADGKTQSVEPVFVDEIQIGSVLDEDTEDPEVASCRRGHCGRRAERIHCVGRGSMIQRFFHSRFVALYGHANECRGGLLRWRLRGRYEMRIGWRSRRTDRASRAAGEEEKESQGEAGRFHVAQPMVGATMPSGDSWS